MNAAELYDRDFAEWAMQNAELLRSGRVAEADLDHIAEEIEDMAKRERRAMQSRLARLIQHLLKWQVHSTERSADWPSTNAAASRLARLIQHLLKWQVQPMKRSANWQSTIAEQRFRICKLLKENPSFRQELANWIDEEYEHAVHMATLDTGFERERFPSSWTYTVEQTLDQGFLPG